MIILINLYPSRRGFPGVINVPFSFVSHHESTVNQERFTSVMPFFSDGALDGISSTNSIITIIIPLPSPSLSAHSRRTIPQI